MTDAVRGARSARGVIRNSEARIAAPGTMGSQAPSIRAVVPAGAPIDDGGAERRIEVTVQALPVLRKRKIGREHQRAVVRIRAAFQRARPCSVFAGGVHAALVIA